MYVCIVWVLSEYLTFPPPGVKIAGIFPDFSKSKFQNRTIKAKLVSKMTVRSQREFYSITGIDITTEFAGKAQNNTVLQYESLQTSTFS